MKLLLDKEKVNTILEERGLTVRQLANHLELSTAEIYNKYNLKSGVSLKQLNVICLYLLRCEHDILTEESMQDLEEHRRDLEYLDTLNAQY